LSSSVNSDAAKESIKTISDIPGPISLPIIGTAWIFFAGAKGEPLGKTYFKMHEEHVSKYGKMFRWQGAGVIVVFLSDPADVGGSPILFFNPKPKHPDQNLPSNP